ncbi:helix-turn-helix transcriptional regulator [Priestia flexa]|uniref:helix-turn-helix transcriptional regulator n=1 Tax=Priestia flexa TaxID=86664 RepID=UPI00249287C1|nr:helix-turn-helix transcriptional regulator [Priestia flexa]
MNQEKRMRLYKERKKKLLSQKEIAQELGIGRGSYIKIENGKADLQLELAKKLSDFFNLTVDELFF